MLLGAAETVIGLTEAFKTYPERHGLYRLGGPRETISDARPTNALRPKTAAMAVL